MARYSNKSILEYVQIFLVNSVVEKSGDRLIESLKKNRYIKSH
ncbi:MAG: hypothetical protein O4805_12900 [Trichodesmium sp. St16_bin2-tuft]|jgi:hypothetical protein|nr:hypothetical protein [Trichodesmium sp. St18_bin1]MDE5087986.1 hypothetical protein [Trichodesmium sp. St16_bin2-tuft]MDE5108610.1 hypothetical protein [Trichodesmium sp. St17_bin3_1_1]